MQEESGWSDLPEHEKRLVLDVAKKNLLRKEPQKMTKQSATAELSRIIEAGKVQLGYMDHSQGDRTIRTQKEAGTSGWLDLREMGMDMPLARSNTRSLLAGEEPGRVIDIPARVALASRVCSFGGAKLIVASDPPPASPGPVVAWSQTAGALVNVEPAGFTEIDEQVDLNAPTTALSAFVHSASISWPDAPSHAFSCTVTRRDQKDHSYDVAQTVMDAIIIGIGRLADDVLLSAISTSRAGQVFTLQAAALAGLKHGELRAIGSDLTSAILRTDGGQLYHGPVPVELSDTINGIVTGSFARAGVAIHPSLRVAVKRLNVDGSMELSCFCNAVAVVPNPAVFWVG